MNYYWDEHCGEIEGLVWGITHVKTFFHKDIYSF